MIADCCTQLNVCVISLVGAMGSLVYCIKLTYDLEKIKVQKK